MEMYSVYQNISDIHAIISVIPPIGGTNDSAVLPVNAVK